MECKTVDKLILYSYVADDLDTYTKKTIENHLETCTQCSAIVKEIRNESENFLSQYPSVPIDARQIHADKKSVWSRPVLALAASLLLICCGMYMFTMYKHNDYGYRIKGSTALDIFVQDEKGNPVKRENNVFYPDEKIQFTYSCGENHYFALLSADTNHAITVYYPSSSDSLIALDPGRDLPLPNSITLDHYIGPELYLAVFSASPLQITHIRELVSGALTECTSLTNLQIDIKNAETRTIVIEKKERMQ